MATGTANLKLLFLSFVMVLLMVSPVSAQEMNLPERAIPAGNTLIPPRALEQLIHKAIADLVKGEFKGNELQFETPLVAQSIPFDEKDPSIFILTTLGLHSPIGATLEPIRVGLEMPDSGLKVKIKKDNHNRFEIHARWKITHLKAKCESLHIQVPKGVFDRTFEIESTPLVIEMTKKSPALTLDLSMTADLTDSGTQFYLRDISTNIDSTQETPDLHLILGKLSIDHRTRDLELKSDGETLTATEEDIRAQFQSLESEIIKNVRTSLNQSLKERIKGFQMLIAKNPPVKLTLQASHLLKDSDGQPALNQLLKDARVDFLLSYIQEVPSPDLYSTQMAAHVCFANECLPEIVSPTQISGADYRDLKDPNSVGFLLYESWLQNVIHSDIFERRFRSYFLDQHKNDGIGLGAKGVRIHFKPEENAVSIVINLEIDIWKTADQDPNFKSALQTRAGALWERYRGAGKLINIPVELTISSTGMIRENNGNNTLHLITKYPFRADGTVLNTYGYPNNTDKMTKEVKSAFLTKVEETIRKQVPEKLSFPLGKDFSFKNYHFIPKSVLITPHKSLMMTIEMGKMMLESEVE